VVVCATSGIALGDGRFAEAVDSPTLLFPLRAWTIPSQFDGGVMLTVGVLSAFGSYLISQGYRLAEATTAAPFEYVVLPMVIMWGVIVFGDWLAAMDMRREGQSPHSVIKNAFWVMGNCNLQRVGAPVGKIHVTEAFTEAVLKSTMFHQR